MSKSNFLKNITIIYYLFIVLWLKNCYFKWIIDFLLSFVCGEMNIGDNRCRQNS